MAERHVFGEGEEPEGFVCVDHLVDYDNGFSEERDLLAFERAERALGWDPADRAKGVNDYDTDEFHEAYALQLIVMLNQESLDIQIKRGILEVDHVTEDGALTYRRGPRYEEFERAFS